MAAPDQQISIVILSQGRDIGDSYVSFVPPGQGRDLEKAVKYAAKEALNDAPKQSYKKMRLMFAFNKNQELVHHCATSVYDSMIERWIKEAAHE